MVTMAISALKELKRFVLKNKSVRNVNVTLNPAVIDELMRSKDSLKSLERRFSIKINLISSPLAHIEDIKIA